MYYKNEFTIAGMNKTLNNIIVPKKKGNPKVLTSQKDCKNFGLWNINTIEDEQLFRKGHQLILMQMVLKKVVISLHNTT